MAQVSVALAALVISTALIFYFFVIAFQVVTPILAKLATGEAFGGFSASALLQNLGIAGGLVGGTFRDSDLLAVAVLLIALAVTVKSRNSPELHRTVEISLLVAGILGFGSLGLVRAVV